MDNLTPSSSSHGSSYSFSIGFDDSYANDSVMIARGIFRDEIRQDPFFDASLWFSHNNLSGYRCPRCADTKPQLSVDFDDSGETMTEQWSCDGCGKVIRRTVCEQSISVSIEAGLNGYVAEPQQLSLPLRFFSRPTKRIIETTRLS